MNISNVRDTEALRHVVSRFARGVFGGSPDVSKRLCLALPFLLLFLHGIVAAKPIPILQDESLDGKVLELSLPVSGVFFQILWVKEDRSYKQFLESKEGPHFYDLRSHSEWSGWANAIVISGITPGRSSLIVPGLLEEVSLFFEPEIISNRRMNFVLGGTIMGFRMEAAMVVFVILVSTLLMWRKKYNIRKALFFSWISLTPLLLIKESYSHFYNIYSIDDNYFIRQTSDIKKQIQNSEKLLQNKSWSFMSDNERVNEIVDYYLAEYKWHPGMESEMSDFHIYFDNNNIRFEKNR